MCDPPVSEKIAISFPLPTRRRPPTAATPPASAARGEAARHDAGRSPPPPAPSPAHQASDPHGPKKKRTKLIAGDPKVPLDTGRCQVLKVAIFHFGMKRKRTIPMLTTC
ncbi:hypothetical protein EJB05_36353, partial [Eragrostis curvula]